MLLSIVIPALNEESTIGIVVQKAIKTLTMLGLEGEIIVVDNASIDKTAQVALSFGAKVVDVQQKGYGSALQGGFAVARGQYIIMADADDSYNLEEIRPFIDQLQNGYDFVLGNRYRGRISPGAMPVLHRYLGTPVLTCLVKLLFKSDAGDINCGMRAFRREAFQDLDCHCPGMEFVSEMIIKAYSKNYKIKEIPCNLYRDKRGKPSHLRSWPDGWRNLKIILYLWFKR